MRSGALSLLVVLSCLACWTTVLASRLAPDQQQLLLSSTPSSGAVQDSPSTPSDPDDKKKKKGSTDFEDQDPDVRSHWALLVAGSSGWFNYRHQADVFHAYQVLLAGGYHRDHIVVMAADDIAQDPENPMPGKVFNMPGGPNVYEAVRVDYRGPDVTAENFLAVLLGDKAAVTGKVTGRVVDSGPHDKVFVFYSDHGAAGVLGMPNGPFLYADEFIKTLKKKHSNKGFKEAVLYIEACESGSMFEGLLGNDLDIYVTTAANAMESSWATYCPSFFTTAAADSSSSGSSAPDAIAMTQGDTPHIATAAAAAAAGSNAGGWQQVVLTGLTWLQQQLGSITAAPQPAAAAAAVGGVKPSPQFTTCLGDLYSVAWMEDAESSNLTAETLLQQYKKIKVRTSQNFTYDQGSHVMQYGDLDIDKELTGDYQGMEHNGSAPTPTVPSSDWTQHAAQYAGSDSSSKGNAALQRYSSPEVFLNRLKSGSNRRHSSSSSSSSSLGARPAHESVEQRDADLVPLAAAATHSRCPRKRTAAAAALRAATAARTQLEGAARAAVSHWLRQPAARMELMSQVSSDYSSVLWHGIAADAPGGRRGELQHRHHQQRQQQQVLLREPSLLVDDDVSRHVEALMGPLPGREGEALVDDWDCLRGMVQAWQAQCGVLDQYGMKLTRLFANLCNAGVAPVHLEYSLSVGPCAGRP